jgi:hypothetical protein
MHGTYLKLQIIDLPVQFAVYLFQVYRYMNESPDNAKMNRALLQLSLNSQYLSKAIHPGLFMNGIIIPQEQVHTHGKFAGEATPVPLPTLFHGNFIFLALTVKPPDEVGKRMIPGIYHSVKGDLNAGHCSQSHSEIFVLGKFRKNMMLGLHYKPAFFVDDIKAVVPDV